MLGTNLDCCVFYGVIINKSELHSISTFDGCTNSNEFLDKYNFDYRFIGSINYSQKMIIGKEIHWDYGANVIELDFDDDRIGLKSEVNTDNDSFTTENEFPREDDEEIIELKQKLQSSGIENNPKFYIITSKE